MTLMADENQETPKAAPQPPHSKTLRDSGAASDHVHGDEEGAPLGTVERDAGLLSLRLAEAALFGLHCLFNDAPD